MVKKRLKISILSVVVLLLVFCFGIVTVSAYSGVLKKESEGSQVTLLQKDLVKLGYLSVEPTGYFGSLTEAGVKKLQKDNGLDVDGIVGNNTSAVINKLLGNTASTVSRGDSSRDGSRNKYLREWFDGAENVLKRDDVATVYDIDSGLSFSIKRTYGDNHADVETLTKEDTAIMKKIFGGEWSWSRRAVIVVVGETKLAASMAGMPHAGREDVKALAYTKNRSGGFGSGTNLDGVKGNNMSGHFDIHFLNSKTHGTSKIDSQHQKMVKKAAAWAEENLD